MYLPTAAQPMATTLKCAKSAKVSLTLNFLHRHPTIQHQIPTSQHQMQVTLKTDSAPESGQIQTGRRSGSLEPGYGGLGLKLRARGVSRPPTNALHKMFAEYSHCIVLYHNGNIQYYGPGWVRFRGDSPYGLCRYQLRILGFYGGFLGPVFVVEGRITATYAQTI